MSSRPSPHLMANGRLLLLPPPTLLNGSPFSLVPPPPSSVSGAGDPGCLLVSIHRGDIGARKRVHCLNAKYLFLVNKRISRVLRQQLIPLV